MIARIISGGQDGADIAALLAAEARGVPTGGSMPLGFRAHSGLHPEYAARFGVVALPSTGYAARTQKNVLDADCTLRIAVNFLSPGERCTLAAILKHEKPVWWDVFLLRQSLACAVEGNIERAVRGIQAVSRQLGRGVVLNVAGNSERTAPGIQCAAQAIVELVIDLVKM